MFFKVWEALHEGIAERCGFKSIYYFSKYFKQTVGVAPSEYGREKNSCIAGKME